MSAVMSESDVVARVWIEHFYHHELVWIHTADLRLRLRLGSAMRRMYGPEGPCVLVDKTPYNKWETEFGGRIVIEHIFRQGPGFSEPSSAHSPRNEPHHFEIQVGEPLGLEDYWINRGNGLERYGSQ